MGGLPERTLVEIEGVLQRFPQIRWVKLYGSRALGKQRPGSDIDLAFSCPEEDCSAALAGALEELPMPYTTVRPAERGQRRSPAPFRHNSLQSAHPVANSRQ